MYCSFSAFTLAAIWRSSVRQHPTVVYQTAWIVANCLTVVLGCGLDWVTHVAGQPSISGIADWTCRIWQAVFGIVRYFGGWIIVAMLVERYLTTRRSQLVKDYCTTCYVKVTGQFLFCILSTTYVPVPSACTDNPLF